MTEKCRICDADETGDRMVERSDDIPLCDRHWSQWVARYAWPSEDEPPCSAHLITDREVGSPDPKETP